MRGIVRICRPGGIVLDPFAGSATTGDAALREGRCFVGCERAEPLLEAAAMRLEQAESDGFQAPLIAPPPAEVALFAPPVEAA
jgi:site-specific DNA-methyltransferase (adenine-specific)